MECCDWIPNLLTGRRGITQLYRSACAAGHKALWHSAWGGLPNRSCLARIHPYLGQIYDSYFGTPMAADRPAGVIEKTWAEKLGLPTTVIVGGSSLDAHAGAVGAGIQPGLMVVSLGTSTVNILVEEPERLADKQLTHVCGQAENSVLPGRVGLETGQAAFGDIYRWFQDLLMWPVEEFVKTLPDLSFAHREAFVDGFCSNLLRDLTSKAEALPIEGALTALDWFNGRRYPYADENLKAAIAGLDLGSGAPEIFQGLVLGTVFGQKRIIDALEKGGVRVQDILAVGGISRKSPTIMQTLADVLQRSIKVCRTTQASARGAAIYAAVGCGAYATIPAAQEVLAGKVERVYRPDRTKGKAYHQAYQHYLRLGECVQGEDPF
jgi:L-ribulokinase